MSPGAVISLDLIEAAVFSLVIYGCAVYIRALWPTLQREWRTRHSHAHG